MCCVKKQLNERMAVFTPKKKGPNDNMALKHCIVGLVKLKLDCQEEERAVVILLTYMDIFFFDK